MNLDSFTGPGSTPSRRRFWDEVTQAVIASQKVAGSNVSVEEHQGYGSIINAPSSGRRATPSGEVGACCDEEGNCTITTEGGCSGTFQGLGTDCDPNPCEQPLGACCYEDETCDDLTASDCEDSGGNWQGAGTTCDDDPYPCICFFPGPTSVTLSGISISCSCLEYFTGNCLGASSSLSCPPPDPWSGECCDSPTSGNGTFALTPSGSIYVGTIPDCIANVILWTSCDCDDEDTFVQPVSGGTIHTACVTENELYDGSPAGWYIWVFSSSFTIFYADGIINPTAGAANTSSCAVAPPVPNIGIGAGGTAILS